MTESSRFVGSAERRASGFKHAAALVVWLLLVLAVMLLGRFALHVYLAALV